MEQDNNPESEITVLEAIAEQYIFCKTLKGDEAKEIYQEVKARVQADFKDVPAFNGYFEFNEQTKQINGSNIPYAIITNQVLEEKGLWLPTIVQAKKLDTKGVFSNNVYRDFGTAVYSNADPNQKVAERIIKQAQK